MPQATMLMGVPTFYVRLLQSPRLDEKRSPTSASSFPVRLHCLQKHIPSSRHAPVTPFSSATA